jgi:hypothetical protein
MNKKFALLAILSILLSGCATTKDVVNVPIPVKCQTPEPKQPDLRFSPPYPNVYDGVRDLIGDREVQLAYEEALRVALKSCK